MLEDIDTRQKLAHPSYTDMEQLNFQILLTDNYYINPNSIHICFPMKIEKKTKQNLDTDADLITANNLFAHFVKEISVKTYGSDKELIPTSSPYEMYQYPDAMLKHLPKDALKMIEKTHLYSKQPADYNHVTVNATLLAETKENYAKDLNINERISKFKEQLKNEHVYRLPLRYFTDIGKINFPTKIDYKIKLHLETEMKRLFERRKVLTLGAALPTPESKIIFTKALYIQYEQILLDKNFRQYLETIMISKKILRMGAQKTSIQKTCKINVGQDSLDIDFLGTNRQFD